MFGAVGRDTHHQILCAVVPLVHLLTVMTTRIAANASLLEYNFEGTTIRQGQPGFLTMGEEKLSQQLQHCSCLTSK